MNRPYIICHMLQSINGSITGRYYEDEKTSMLAKSYAKMSEQFNGDGIIYGSITAKELFGSNESKQIYSDVKDSFKKDDFIVQNNNRKWIVVFDPEGIVTWTEKSLENRRLIKKNIIVILLEKVSHDYLLHLQKLGISYLIAGKTDIDIKNVLNKLYEKCSIQKLLLQGGGKLNASFMNENLIDEISLMIAPNVNISQSNVMCFEESPYSKENELIKYTMSDCQILSHSGIWLHYKKR